MFDDFTTIVALDYQHLAEFRMAWPLWRQHKPELLTRPFLIVVHPVQPIVWWRNELRAFFDHPAAKIVEAPVPSVECTQRHLMLSSFVFCAARHVETEYHLKIDTDTFASGPDSGWIRRDAMANKADIIAPPWSYTKPARMIHELNQWAERHPAFRDAHAGPLPVDMTKPDGRLGSKRFTSWLMFGRTEFIQFAASLCRDTDPLLPIGSQDTFLYYVAHRLGRRYVRYRMQQHHWGHGRGGLRDAYQKFLAS
jgi:hypothetical protein